MLKVHTRSLGPLTVLCLEGRIVNGETATLRHAVNSQSRVGTIVLDLARVSTVDASGLGLMLELRQQTEARGVRFKLMNATKFVRRIFEITGLDSVFEVTSSVEFLPAISRTQRASVMKLAPCA
jgi:anti-sigma B factor antagonist